MASGVDSLTPADACCYGGTYLAAYVKSYYTGTTPRFWGRYFGVAAGRTMDQESSSEIQAECSDMKAQGIRWIVPINAPASVNGTYSNGAGDGQRACNAIATVLSKSAGKLALPGNNHLRVYLDVEPGEAFSQDYWNGWSTAVHNYRYDGRFPFYPACYCNPADGRPCVNFANGPFACDAVWANESNSGCSGCLRSPTWAPKNCSNVHTRLWQYDIQPVCVSSSCRGSSFPPIDLDKTNPSFDGRDPETNYMLYIP